MITKECGPHCGIIDGIEGHCVCGMCHTRKATKKRKKGKDK